MNHSKKQFASNVASGWMVQLVFAAVGFILMPYIIKRLGSQSYGIYQLARSAIAFFMFLQLGMGPTLVRFFAKSIAKKDHEEIRRIGSTAQLLLGGLGLIAAALCWTLIPVFLSFYEIPTTLVRETTGLLVCMGFSLFINMSIIVPQGLVFGLNRYELANGVEIISHLLRLLLVVALFEWISPSILYVGLSMLAASLWRFIALYSISLRHLKWAALFSIKHVRREAFHSLLGFSTLNLMNSIAAALVFQGPVLIIGKCLGEDMVAAFSPALIIAGAMQGFLGRTARPLVPIASRDVAKNSGRTLGHWSLYMGQFVAFIGFGSVLPLAVFGPELMQLWLGSDFRWTWSIVAVISTGAALAQIQAPNYFLALGGGSIRPTVYSQVAMSLIVLIGTFIGLAWLDWGLFAVALFIGLCILVRNTFYLAFAYSRQFSYSYAQYLYSVYAVPCVIAGTCAGAGWGFKRFFPTVNMWILIVEVGVVLLGYVLLCWISLVPRLLKRRLIDTARCHFPSACEI